MNTLADLGFVLTRETQKALYWSCPLGSFWEPKHKPAVAGCAVRLDNLEVIASRAADAINASWVPVNVLERTVGGAARVTFSARRSMTEEEFYSGPRGATEKRATLHLPAGWLIQRGGQFYAPTSKLSEKLDEHQQFAARHSRRTYPGWRPVTGQLTTAGDVLAWLREANSAALQQAAAKRQRAEDERRDRQLERYNRGVADAFDAVLVQQYAETARAYRKTVRGKAADLPDPRLQCSLVRSCLKNHSVDFLKFSAKRTARAARAAEAAK